MMIRNRGAWVALSALVLAAALLSGCGGSDSTTTASAPGVAVVKVMPTPGLGRVLVDAEGMTLYDSHGDNPMLYQFNRPPTPSCYEDCAEAWPPLLTDSPPKAMGGAKESMLGTIRREDGTLQVTYDGHPLYTYVEDENPGETNGDYAVSFGEGWHALEPDGEEPTGGHEGGS